MKEELKETTATAGRDISRRRFLGYASLAGAGLLAASCHKDNDNQTLPKNDDAVDLGSGDIGLLNYAFALEQLEAAFYTKMCTSFFTNITAGELRAFPQIRDHEIAHREFLRNVLKGNAIPDLEFDFSSINFSDRTSVLTAAKQMEDIGVSAYLNVAKRFVTPDYLLVAMKMQSVESRHAAYLRDSLDYNSFASGTDANGLDTEMIPEDVIAATAKYFKRTLSTKRLPKS